MTTGLQDTGIACTGIIISWILSGHRTLYDRIHWLLFFHLLSQTYYTIYSPLMHGYTNARTTACYISVIIVTWILIISLLHMHVGCLYSCHMDPRSCYMYYCSMLLYSCYMIDSRYWYCWIPIHATCITVPCYCIHGIWLYPVTDMDFPILDLRAVDMLYVDFHIYWSRFPLYCSRYIDPVILFLIPVILYDAINRALVQLSCYPYHIL